MLIIMPLLIFLLTLISGAILISETGANGILALPLIAFCIILAWLTWSLAVTHWRIWAFTNVRNAHELQAKAVSQKLIWPRGSFFERTEIRTRAQRLKLLELEQRLEQPDIFYDDPSIPSETIIRFSKRDKMIAFCIGSFLIAIGIYGILKDQFAMAAIFLAGDYLAIKSYRQMRNREPQLTLNEQGMQVKDGPFMEWQLLSRIDVSQTHFRYRIANLSDHALELAEFDKDASAIEKHVRIYIGRYEQSQM
ncbi:hypothetical protein HC229_08620 [Flavobacterium sp. D33]|nr:hypothetical protein [Flavobacterium selenitireducens]